jgi:hypothetical protein
VDISLVKFINVTERYKVQFRVDAFNVLNHPNFSLPALSLYTNIVNSNLATPTPATCNVGSGTQCGQAQFALGEVNPVSETTSSSVGKITQTATDNRELQFALKILF